VRAGLSPSPSKNHISPRSSVLHMGCQCWLREGSFSARVRPIKDEPDLVIPPAHLCLPVLVLFKGARCRQAAGQGAGPAGALAL